MQNKTSSSANETPLMRQHHAIKQNYPDAILLFRVGDFYETFGQDAIDVSGILHITLTKRNNGVAGSIELAGFPHHALDTYLHKIVKAGRRVAICDQLEDPKQAKGIVKRGITEIITPGVTTNEKILNAESNNYLAAIDIKNNHCGIAFIDVSTTSFFVAEGDLAFIQKLLESFAPSEIILSKSNLPFFEQHMGKSYYTYALEDWIFDYTYNKDQLIEHFGVHHSLKGFGLDNKENATVAAGVVLHYLKEIKHPNTNHIHQIQYIQRNEHLWMDQFTIRNLEIISGTFPLLNVIDGTKSAMGSRLLKQWVIMPQKDKQRIEERLSLTDFFFNNTESRLTIQTQLKSCGDIERIAGKVPTRKITPREVKQIANALDIIGNIKQSPSLLSNDYLQRLLEQINPCHSIAQKIHLTLVDDPPLQIGKTDLIRDSVHAELDELRQLLHSNKEHILSIQQHAIEETGIGSLKIGFNHVFGYYLEVSRHQMSKVPNHWIRKQTLANAERYITQELKAYEEKVLHAQDTILQIEQTLYDNLLKEIEEIIPIVIHNCRVIAIIDCLQGFATKAIENNYTKPTMTEEDPLQLTVSRHPVIEKSSHLSQGGYIPNDIYMDEKEQQVLIITGPNMSGKSAIIRQTALNILMAHMGSFVACDKAIIPITDKIFTRVGASDNLSQGESTFMVEMNETASILNTISPRSLVLLDEIGRGTSTYDGISIAWSILEYLATHPSKPKVLFSTHYHEIVAVEKSFDNVKNFHVSNKEEKNTIIFLRKLKPGGSTHSFGIHVAKMAGLPPLIIERAYAILDTLEQKEETSTSTTHHLSTLPDPKAQQQPLTTEDILMDNLKETIYQIDIDRLTPIEALLKIQELKRILSESPKM